MVYLRALFFAVIIPGTVTIPVPCLLAYTGVLSFEPGQWRYLGLIPLIPGALILLASIFGFAKKGRGTLAPVDPPKRVVREGMHAWVRNPMYIGVVSIIAGESLIYGSWLVLIWAALCAACFHFVVVFYEEPGLRRAFGADYDDYCARVSRWLPRRPHL